MKSATVLFLMTLALSFGSAGCSSTPEQRIPRTFDHREMLLDHLEELLDQGASGAVVDRLNSGLIGGLLSAPDVGEWMSRVIDAESHRFRIARVEEDWETVLQSVDNIRILLSDPLQVGLEYSPGEELELPARDEILLWWSLAELDRQEEVLALYRLLRRSTLDDLSEEQRIAFRHLAERFNNSEALRRLEVSDTDEPILPEVTSADLLAGTVTVWVNRGMRISGGVGVPDRVIGSGFFVDPRGYVITNYHVISSEVDPTYNGFSRLYVKLPGRSTERIPARVVGYDRVFDIALLKVEIDPPIVMSLSDVRRLVPGERVLALGSPGGLDSTITSGIVSASGRRFLQIGEAVQIDAPVNPGNSGGPLVLPDDGQVAAVVFAGIPQFEGVNFVIPAYWIRHFFPRLFTDGAIVHPWLGVSLHEGSRGLTAVYVVPGSPVQRSGVQVGERLTHINGVAVSDMIDAQDLILGGRPGSLVVTDWIDSSGTEVRRLLALDQRPFSPVEDAMKSQPIEELFPVLFGMNVDELAGSLFGPDYVITDVLPGSIADESSLSVNDPFSLRNWHVDRDARAAFIQIVIRKRKAGFLETGLQLGAYLETNSFL